MRQAHFVIFVSQFKWAIRNLLAVVDLGSDEFVQAMQDRLADDAKLSHQEIPRMQRRALV